MKITMCAKEHVEFTKLAECVPHLSSLLFYLSKEYKFSIPNHIILRGKRQGGRKNSRGIVYARMSHRDGTFYLSLNLRSTYGIMDTIVHEVAHIADYQKHREWKHGKTFKEMYEKAKELREKCT